MQSGSTLWFLACVDLKSYNDFAIESYPFYLCLFTIYAWLVNLEKFQFCMHDEYRFVCAMTTNRTELDMAHSLIDLQNKSGLINFKPSHVVQKDWTKIGETLKKRLQGGGKRLNVLFLW